MNSNVKILTALALLAALGAFLILHPSHGPGLLAPCAAGPHTVTVHLYDDPAQLRAAWERAHRRPATDQVLGFAGRDPVTGAHHVYAMAPRGQRDGDRIETLGHEMLHVACGAWHP